MWTRKHLTKEYRELLAESDTGKRVKVREMVAVVPILLILGGIIVLGGWELLDTGQPDVGLSGAVVGILLCLSALASDWNKQMEEMGKSIRAALPLSGGERIERLRQAKKEHGREHVEWVLYGLHLVEEMSKESRQKAGSTEVDS